MNNCSSHIECGDYDEVVYLYFSEKTNSDTFCGTFYHLKTQ